MRAARSLATGLLEFPLPVVAAVRGAAVGVGCTVALLCDLMVMEESAYLLDPHLRVGLVAGDGGATLWPFVTTPQKTKEILFLAGRVTAQDAESMGLANRVAPDGEGLSTALALAHRLAEVPQGALEATKRTVNMPILDRLRAAMDFSLAAEEYSFDTAEHRELARKTQNGRS